MLMVTMMTRWTGWTRPTVLPWSRGIYGLHAGTWETSTTRVTGEGDVMTTVGGGDKSIPLGISPGGTCMH